MKKATLTSKCGKKVEIYYLTDHPANKMPVAENATLEIEDYNKASSSKEALLNLAKKMMDGGTNNPITIKLPPKGTKDATSFGWSMEKPTLGTELPLDDSIKSDEVEGEPVSLEIYKIRGLNIIAQYTNLEGTAMYDWSCGNVYQRPPSNSLYGFCCHDFEFLVGRDMILKATDSEKAKYIKIQQSKEY